MSVLSIMVLTSALTALSALPLDVMLPSFGAMAEHYGVAIDRIEILVSIFAITFALCQLVTGPVSDYYGRRRILIAGLTIATTGATGAALSDSYAVHLCFRVIQAIGCSCFVLGQAIIQNALVGPAGLRARIFNVSFSGLCIAVSPLLGALLQTIYGWQASFWMFSALAISTSILAHCCLTGMPQQRSGSARDCFRIYGRMVRSPSFIANNVIASMAFTCHFAFILLSPAIYVVILDYSTFGYALVLTVYGVVYLAGGLLTDLTARTMPLRDQVKLGIRLIAAAAMIQILLMAWLGEHLLTALAPISLATVGTAYIRPASTTLAMDIFNDNAGAAAAASGTIRFALAGSATLLGSVSGASPFTVLWTLMTLTATSAIWLRTLTHSPNESGQSC